MEQDVNLKAIEGKAYRSMRQDGLDSVMEGVSLALMALFLYDRRHGWAFVLGAGMQFWHWLKVAFRRRFTDRLLPRAKIQPLRNRKGVMRAIAGVVLMALLGILLIPVSGPEAQGNVGFSMEWILPVYAGLMLAGLAFAAATDTDMPLTISSQRYFWRVSSLVSCSSSLGSTSARPPPTSSGVWPPSWFSLGWCSSFGFCVNTRSL